MKKIILFIMAIIGNTSAQTWSDVKKLMNYEQYYDADRMAQKKLDQCIAVNDQQGMLIGVSLLWQIDNAYNLAPFDSLFARCSRVMPKLQDANKAMGHLLMAMAYNQYKENNRWSIRDNRPTDEPDLSYEQWDPQRFNDTIAAHMRQCLAFEDELKQTPSANYELFLTRQPMKGIDVTPTLYCVAALTAIEDVEYADSEELWNNVRQYYATLGDTLHLWAEIKYLDWMHTTGRYNADQYLAANEALYAQFQNKECGKQKSEICAEIAEIYNGRKDYPAALAWCDKGEALKDTPGAARCFNVRHQIIDPVISLETRSFSTTRHGLAILSAKNVSQVTFRVVRNIKEDYWSAKYREKICNQPSLAEWKIDIVDSGDHMMRNYYVDLPDLQEGDYVLLATPGSAISSKNFINTKLQVSDLVLLANNYGESVGGYVVDRLTGRPVEGQTVKLHSWIMKIDQSANTDKNGFFLFQDTEYEGYSYDVYVERNGVRQASNTYMDRQSTDGPDCPVYVDRPVYRPGDTVQFFGVSYARVGNTAHTLDDTIQAVLRDPNGRDVGTLDLKPDAFGLVSGQFVLPASGLAGNYLLRLGKYNSCPVRVEYYKQPKFRVTMDPVEGDVAFDSPMQFRGRATAYSGAPISGAEVKYTVTRRALRPWWYWWWNAPFEPDKVVADGTLRCEADGTFAIDFTPQKSDTPSAAKRFYTFEVEVDVTDLNGETHNASKRLNLGDENRFISIDAPAAAASLSALEFDFLNLDRQPQQGSLRVKAELLQRPQIGLEYATGRSNVIHLDSPADFAAKHPYMAYDYKAKADWPVARQVADIAVDNATMRDALGRYRVPLPALADGVYRFTVTSADGIENYSIVTITSPKAKQVQVNDLLWHAPAPTTAEVGSTVCLRVGSAYSDVTLFYAIAYRDHVDHGTLRLNNSIATLDIPVTERMLGGFTVSLFAQKEIVSFHSDFHVDVPYTHKQLQLAIATFRDKLEPGETERWTLTVKDHLSQGLPANVALTMFDAALLNYGPLSWNIKPFQSGFGRTMLYHNPGSTYSSDRLIHTSNASASADNFVAWQLNINSGDRYGYKKTYSRSKVANMPATSVNSIVSAVGGVGYSEGATARGEDGMVYEMEEEAEGFTLMAESAVLDEVSIDNEASPDQPAAAPDQPLRSNMNTLAFFEPALRTNAQGEVEYCFTLPDLLTEWRLNGLAWNPQLQSGTLQRSLVAQKQLMVQPNMPRFLRQGDTAVLLAKVVNLSDEDREVQVDFEMLGTSQHRMVSVPARNSASVSFPVTVGNDVFLADYRITATSGLFSDGEQAAVPVLTNRQLVTQSMAMYINGAGEKHYSFDLLKNATSATIQHQLLALEFTSNPLWYAIQSLPYVKAKDDPSNISLVNQIYTNSLSLKVVSDNPAIQNVFEEWLECDPDAFLSNLERNADIKQLVAEETPWLCEAQNEQQRKRDVALFFNADELNAQLDQAVQKLQEAQFSNGAWSWIPGGRYESQYITQYILKQYGQLHQLGVSHKADDMLGRALSYVDREEQRIYQKYYKGKSFSNSVTDIDYLYMRSFYPGSSFASKSKECYDVYYANLKKSCLEPASLYTRAITALVLYRHGDVKLARELVNRLKQSALVSDEMGMYWRDNTASCWWYQRPIETQALLIQAFNEITNDSLSVALMQQWLLKQKQTTSWSTDVSTVNAIQALLCGASQLHEERQLDILVGGLSLNAPVQRGTGYRSQRWAPADITPDMSRVDLVKHDQGIAWGAMYWQYFDDLDKIPTSDMGISLQKTLYRASTDGTLQRVTAQNLYVGDRVMVRIVITADRNLEYLELRDQRPANLEPLSTRSGWNWNGGLPYYLDIHPAHTSFFIDRIEKGEYVLEYELYVTNPGTFSAGIATMQCLYAPEFRSNTQGIKITAQ